MAKIVCTNCEREIIFTSMSDIPSECPYCSETIDSAITIIEEINGEVEISGLTIIYQLTQQRIEIPASNKVILGRKGIGANVFSGIQSDGRPVISRNHCSIEFKDGSFYLMDEGSLNGTFYGENKVSCKSSPQKIENNSIIFLGEEAFITEINLKNTPHKSEENLKSADENRKIKLYRCNQSNCAYESQSKPDMCPKCCTYNSLVPIYE